MAALARKQLARAPEGALIPLVGDRYFVPRTLWPDEDPQSTPHGKGWLATITALTEQNVSTPGKGKGKRRATVARHESVVAFRCDGEAAPVEMTLSEFWRHCVPLGDSPNALLRALGSEDVLLMVLEQCDLGSVLALEVTERRMHALVRRALPRSQ